MITIVDYGMGNLRSVQKAFERLDIPAQISTSTAEIGNAEKLVLPGVGAFRDAIAELRRLGLDEPIKAHIAADKPFLGICLGMQLLMEASYEDGEWEGLGVLPGTVVRFDDQPGLKVPHMGWNQLEIAGGSPLLDGISAEAYFYFVHSYYVDCQDQSVIAARTSHGCHFVSMLSRGNLFATQFHPEKSQREGLQLLRNFGNVPVSNPATSL